MKSGAEFVTLVVDTVRDTRARLIEHGYLGPYRLRLPFRDPADADAVLQALRREFTDVELEVHIVPGPRLVG